MIKCNQDQKGFLSLEKCTTNDGDYGENRVL